MTTDGAPRSPNQVLARKWRPRRFAELVGQDHVVRALSNALDSGRLHHAYLFTGTRGVGKTTTARILAKALNCETGLSSNPCGVCTACREIDTGRFVDLVEVDAATNTRVEEMRDLLDQAQYLPVKGRFKVYIIDEVHMLSRSAFNSMLKTLEEPPEHVKFILATTDPQKVPVTVLSRCLQFNLKQMAPQTLADHLADVLGREQIPFDGPALQLVARAARGSMRDGLSLLDQAIAYGGGRVEGDAVSAMLGTISQDHLFDLLDALVAGHGKALVGLADAMVERSLSLETALQDLASLLHVIAIRQTVPEAADPDEPGADRIEALSAALSAEDVQLYYQIALIGRRDIALAPNEQTGFVMTLLRMLAFRIDDGGSAAERPTRPPGTAVPGGGAPRSVPSRPTSAGSGAVGAGSPPRAAAAGESATAALRAVRPATTSAEAPAPRLRPVPAAPPPASEPEPEPPYAAAPSVDLPTDEPGWHELVRGLEGSGVAAELAKHCEFSGQSGGAFALLLPERHKQLLPFRDKLRAALQARYGQGVRVEVTVVGDERGRSVAALDDVVRRDRLAQAMESIESDAFVREMKERFGARVIESTVRPEDG